MINRLFPPLIGRHFIFITIFCILIVIPTSYSDDDEQYVACSSSNYFSCGSNGLNISYPFWGNERPPYCGRQGFELKCHPDIPHPTIETQPQKFIVFNISTTDQTMTIAPDYLDLENYCPRKLENTTFKKLLFNYSPNVQNLSVFYDCPGEFSSPGPNNYSCEIGGEARKGFYTVDGIEDFKNLTAQCKEVIKFPVIHTLDLTNGQQGREWLRVALYQGFYVKYEAADNLLCSECVSSGGICGSNESNPEQFVCLCSDKHHAVTCPGSDSNSRLKFVIGGVAAGSGIIATCLIVCHLRWKISAIISTAFSGKTTKNDQDIEAFIRNFEHLAPKRYSFSDVKKMTNSFKDKLGQGGYGGVYKGKLSDGQIVAVKLLNTPKGNGQEFINEVASISRTSHVNVVTLLGFCIEGSKRALIYEFMPNGSLEKFIYNEENLKANQCLGWEKMYDIAIGIARGLEYLHRGCSIKILHLDIKPHNILLDEDFCPKISDFGLAKLCPKKESIVIMSNARGTIGYIAPEVFNRNFGQVSHKSDVYSYGMMILEMVGGRKNPDARVLHTSETYFPHWIYKHVEQGKELKWHGVSTNVENEIAKKLIIVGLWCIQIHPSDRPSMNKAIEMLQGNTETLQIPTEHFRTSPSTLQLYSSTTSIS